MKYLAKLAIIPPLLLLAACSRDTSDAGPRAAAAVAAIALQSEEYKTQREELGAQRKQLEAQREQDGAQRAISPTPSAPIELDYQMPGSAPAGRPLGIELILNTPLDSGELIVSVTKQVGLTLLSDTVRHIDLSRAERPLRVPLQIMPGNEAQRSLIVTASVEVGGERQMRNFRISLPSAN
ncbi:MAG TPA: hypothetical protein VLC91_14065 [Spongiibacteraceae bacterium]|nr:hypothetical protein [Spongiibacteraceae bacterium]